MPVLQTPIDDETYQGLGWLSLAAAPTDRHFNWRLAEGFGRRAHELEEAGHTAEAQAFGLMGGAISMHMRHGSHSPFGPAWQANGRRSMAMEDLGGHDVALLARAARDAPFPWLKARFADLAVSAPASGRSDWRLGQLAVEAYLDHVSSVFGTEWAIDGLNELHRGLVLLRVYAKKDQTLWNRYWDVILEEVPHAIAHDWPGLVFPLCDEAMLRSRGACDTIIPLIEAKATQLDAIAPQEAARWHHQVHRMHERLRHRAEANAALMAQGEAMTKAAEFSATQQPPLAPMQLTEAIGLLRRAKAPPSRIKELRDRLAEYERASLDHYGQLVHPIDVSDLVKHVDRQMLAPDFFSALLRMAYRVQQWINVHNLERRVRENAQQHPLIHMFGVAHANADGTIVSHQWPFNADDPTSVRQHMIKDATRFEFSMRGQVTISHAAELLHCQYQPSFHTIKEIVEASTITPHSKAETIARGLFFGLIGDWTAASVYLIPTMEPFVRAQLQRIGAHTAALDDDGTQRERTLGEMLDMPEAADFFGENLLFELKVHLTEPLGFNLRNAYCHGLMSDDELRNVGTISLWWVIWRMVLFPWHDHPSVLASPESMEEAVRASSEQP